MAKKPSNFGKRRIQIDFSIVQYLRLKKSRTATNAPTDASVIRRALFIFGFIRTFQSQGWKPVMVNKETGHTVELTDDNIELFRISTEESRQTVGKTSTKDK
ncbi:MAG: hypothetical protein V4690_02070 [Patescibacteria group bacterium]